MDRHAMNRTAVSTLHVASMYFKAGRVFKIACTCGEVFTHGDIDSQFVAHVRSNESRPWLDATARWGL